MKKYLAVVAVVVLGFFAWRVYQKLSPKDAGRQGNAPVPVVVAKVVKKSVPLEVRTFGTVEPNAVVTVRPQMGGVISAVHFREGQDVKSGDMLFSIDPSQAEAALRQAEASLAKDRAQRLAADRELARQVELLKKGFTSEDLTDQARSAAETLAAAISAGEAAVSNAAIQLAYCSIRSPIDGRTGSFTVNSGNVVKPGDTALVTINQVRPVKVRFVIPQQNLPTVLGKMSQGKLTVLAVIPQDKAGPCRGELTFIDNNVDPATGTVELKATFPNEDQRLWPGQFVNVILTLLTQEDAIVVPSSAVQTGQKGTYVFVVKADMSVENRPVAVDRSMGDDVILSGGATAGEDIVSDGQLRIVPGCTVTTNAGMGAAAAGGAKAPKAGDRAAGNKKPQ